MKCADDLSRKKNKASCVITSRGMRKLARLGSYSGGVSAQAVAAALIHFGLGAEARGLPCHSVDACEDQSMLIEIYASAPADAAGSPVENGRHLLLGLQVSEEPLLLAKALGRDPLKIHLN